MTADVFISYRGADRVLARKLENRLRSRWGSRVFRDESGLTGGRNWAEELAHAMRDARVTIALVGPGWQISTDPDKEDWVRRELATAVDGGKPILPVLVGNPDELKSKLSAMPSAFQRQAVEVGPELAGFDLHKIARALKQLGAFANDDTWSLASRRDEMVPVGALKQARAAIAAGKSLLILGSSGSGRNALVRRLASELRDDGHMVAAHGLGRCAEPRQNHEVIAGWIASLAETFSDSMSTWCGQESGAALVRAVLRAGPDLLSRQVVLASTLLPLGDTSYDQKILEAVRRRTDRWAPFPPTRLMHQSRGVLEALHAGIKDFAKRPILIVDHFESVDSVSADLVRDLIEHPIGDASKPVGLIIAAYAGGANARHTVRRLMEEAAQGQLPVEMECIHVDEVAAWGGAGNNLEPWLNSHGVRLAENVKQYLKDEPNPYRVLSRLWYLVDNGYVSDAERSARNDSAETETNVSGDSDIVLWDATHRDGHLPQITDDALLEHMITEHVPVGYRRIVEAGALIGRTFSFYAAYYAAHPPAEDETIDETLSSRESAQWLQRADKVWAEMKEIDPEASVLSCKESCRGGKTISLAQADLVGHLRGGVSARSRRGLHERIARYLVNPMEKLATEVDGDQYNRAELAARHWGLAERPRDAADAHRHAAEIAERSLAYRESRTNYETAIRLYTQLLADLPDLQREHEDLLILSNSLYRVGQASRLAGKPDSARDRRAYAATYYLEQALARLADLKTVLLDQNPKRWPQEKNAAQSRNIPSPDRIRHHLRLYEALSGHVQLELALCHEAEVTACKAEAGDELHSCESCAEHDSLNRDRLFDALRHAEAARGEAGSRWLLASASARLAAMLTDEALRCRRTVPQRSHNLAVEAFFHIERIIGLRARTLEEERDLADAVAWAWRSAGRLFRHHAGEPHMALWAYKKMNAHGNNTTVAVDMITDRWLGGFLLSICRRGQQDGEIEQARFLLERYRDWAIESGIVDARTPAHLRLYLLELVRSSDRSDSGHRMAHLDAARQHAVTDRQRRDCAMFEALELVLGRQSNSQKNPAVIARFRTALGMDDSVGSDQVLQQGWTRLSGILVRRCPALADLVEQLVKPVLPGDWKDEESDLRYWTDWARRFLRVWKVDPVRVPCLDGGIERLARLRLPSEVFRHAGDTARRAKELLSVHEDRCAEDEGVARHILEQDVKYAAFMHDWYVAIDPSRMLTLASEWNLTVSGVEWSNPNLLHGRLAVAALKQMYSAETELGSDRYRRIAQMVDHHSVARAGASALEKVFFLANALSEATAKVWHRAQPVPGSPGWQALAFTAGKLDQAYALAKEEKEREVRDAGNPVISHPLASESGAAAPPDAPDVADALSELASSA